MKVSKTWWIVFLSKLKLKKKHLKQQIQSAVKHLKTCKILSESYTKLDKLSVYYN